MPIRPNGRLRRPIAAGEDVLDQVFRVLARTPLLNERVPLFLEDLFPNLPNMFAVAAPVETRT
jgi:hypothetical protein